MTGTPENPLVFNPLVFRDCVKVTEVLTIAFEFLLDAAEHLNDDPSSHGYRPEVVRRVANTTMCAILDLRAEGKP